MSLVFIVMLTALSVVCLPWRWLVPQVIQVRDRTSDWVLKQFPMRYQSALKGIAFIELRLLGSMAASLAFAIAIMNGHGTLALVFITILLGEWLPVHKVLKAHRQHQLQIVSALPTQLDLLAMLLNAGQPLLSSLDQAGRAPRPNALQQEFSWVVGQVRSGEPLQRAIRAFAQRNPSREIRLMCHALQHARESGAGLADILQQQAEQRRQELFLAAERRAMEAPVKMMFPLLLFIFPATIVVLGVTLAAKVMWGT